MIAPRPTYYVDGASIRTGATFSPCGLYRYDLTREFDPSGPWLLAILCNPSTADAHKDDPTLRRMIDFAHGFSFPNLAVTNLWALRSTDPKGIVTAKVDPVGPDNRETIARWLGKADQVVFGWGYSAKIGKRMLTRAWEVRRDIRDAFKDMTARGVTTPPCAHLGLTEGKERQPRHPLMLRADTAMTRIEP